MGTRYHDGTAATPVDGNAACPDPLAATCASGKPKKAAYLEGPINCNGEVWYCRIEEEAGWPTANLLSDTNFGYCNTQEGFEDPGYDKAGHCHGSDRDETFYWWVRDHWFRGYNGKLRCCCGWKPDVLEGTIVNRCDHRRLVTRGTAENCRDANEDGSSPYNGGCKGSPAIGQPIPEDDSKCWEISKFGFSDDGPEDNENNNNNNEDNEQDNEEEEEENEEEEEEEEEEECKDVRGKFIWKVKKGKTMQKNCKWLAKKKNKAKLCKKKTSEGIRAREHCPVTCDTC